VGGKEEYRVHRTGELYGQFETLEQQKDSATLGMWVFLVKRGLGAGSELQLSWHEADAIDAARERESSSIVGLEQFCDEAVAAAVDGLDHLLAATVVANRRSCGSDAAAEYGFADVTAAPDLVKQPLFGDEPPALRDEKLEYVEHLRLD